MPADLALLLLEDAAYPGAVSSSQPARKVPRWKVVKPKVAKAKRAGVVKKAASRVKSTEKAYAR